MIRREHDDAVVAILARQKKGAGDQVCRDKMMRDGEPADLARRDVQRLGGGDQLDEDAVIAIERRDAGSAALADARAQER